MWTIAIVWLGCAAIFLELAARAPTIEDPSPGTRLAGEGVDVGKRDVNVVKLPERPSRARIAAPGQPPSPRFEIIPD